MPRGPVPETNRQTSVFINAPYGSQHQDVFLAYIVGAVSLGLTPRAAIETYGTDTSRLERIHALIRDCKYSFHDLSFVDLDVSVGVPRFNMPLELGIAIAEQYRTRNGDRHEWLAFDSVRYRTQVSTSDLNGFDPLCHDGTADGVLRELLANVDAPTGLPHYSQMRSLLHAVRDGLQDHFNATGQETIFSPVMFRRVVSATVSLLGVD